MLGDRHDLLKISPIVSGLTINKVFFIVLIHCVFPADVCSVCGDEFDTEGPDVDFYVVDGICSLDCMFMMFKVEDVKNSFCGDGLHTCIQRYKCRNCDIWLELDDEKAKDFFNHCQVCPQCFSSM